MSAEFAVDYQVARQRFRELAAASGAQQDELQIDSQGPNGEALTINTAWLGARDANHLVLHLSGVHGVEGFAGSAVQCDLLTQLPALRARQALLLIHSVNPFGMAWLRRVNENNVDLNRNCIAPDERYAGAPPDYPHLNRFLNPAGPVARVDRFYSQAVWWVARYGFARLSQSIAGGQYDFPRGIFYGGAQLEQSPRLVLEWLRGPLARAESVFAIDLHTGLGKYGRDMLITSYPVDSEKCVALRREVGESVRGLRGTSYQAHGTLYNAIERLAPHAHLISLCHEFGTYSSLHVLHQLRAENQLWWSGRRDDLAHRIKKGFHEAFIPAALKWRSNVVKRGRELVEKALRSR